MGPKRYRIVKLTAKLLSPGLPKKRKRGRPKIMRGRTVKAVERSGLNELVWGRAGGERLLRTPVVAVWPYAPLTGTNMTDVSHQNGNFSIKNGIWKPKGLDLGREPCPLKKKIWVDPRDCSTLWSTVTPLNYWFLGAVKNVLCSLHIVVHGDAILWTHTQFVLGLHLTGYVNMPSASAIFISRQSFQAW